MPPGGRPAVGMPGSSGLPGTGGHAPAQRPAVCEPAVSATSTRVRARPFRPTGSGCGRGKRPAGHGRRAPGQAVSGCARHCRPTGPGCGRARPRAAACPSAAGDKRPAGRGRQRSRPCGSRARAGMPLARAPRPGADRACPRTNGLPGAAGNKRPAGRGGAAPRSSGSRARTGCPRLERPATDTGRPARTVRLARTCTAPRSGSLAWTGMPPLSGLPECGRGKRPAGHGRRRSRPSGSRVRAGMPGSSGLPRTRDAPLERSAWHGRAWPPRSGSRVRAAAPLVRAARRVRAGMFPLSGFPGTDGHAPCPNCPPGADVHGPRAAVRGCGPRRPWFERPVGCGRGCARSAAFPARTGTPPLERRAGRRPGVPPVERRARRGRRWPVQGPGGADGDGPRGGHPWGPSGVAGGVRRSGRRAVPPSRRASRASP
ncbi:hypothetical protein SPRI_4592 [Streptomyces pristinaespiralis]|uniref:Uncharacterized protein n=1 Tax=Streptomyces pristinaespiralis TaxID=38300 RepID=A0A0M5IUA8_STRPR|nr:hypothetical protein SPRI_4592 [Streptomyces pristinaespiralis]